jgi:hypothetical protein
VPRVREVVALRIPAWARPGDAGDRAGGHLAARGSLRRTVRAHVGPDSLMVTVVPPNDGQLGRSRGHMARVLTRQVAWRATTIALLAAEVVGVALDGDVVSGRLPRLL